VKRAARGMLSRGARRPVMGGLEILKAPGRGLSSLGCRCRTYVSIQVDHVVLGSRRCGYTVIIAYQAAF
jgi:hypothetical protein